VLTDAGMKPGREVLNELEQVRFVFGRILGKSEMEAVWPFRVVLLSSSQDAAKYNPGAWRLGRDAWILALAKGQKRPLGQLVRILLEANTQRMTGEVERGLLEVFDTVQVDATRVTLGIPPPPERRGLAWARMHLLCVDPKYSGRVRVLFSNLQLGTDWHAAYKNTLGATPGQIEEEVKRYLDSGAYAPRTVSGAPVSVRDFSARDFEPVYIETALADLLDGETAKAAYTAILQKTPDYADALDGAGRFADSVVAGSRNARCLVEYGKMLQQASTARNAFVRASKLNPRWDEPYVQMAKVDTNLSIKMNSLKHAAERNPRNDLHWKALAEAYTEANQFQLAAGAWGDAMRAAPTKEASERYYQARLALEEKRGQAYTNERLDRIEERKTETRRMREEWADMLQRAKETGSVDDPDTPAGVVEWWDDERPKGKIRGTLNKVDCIGGLARLVIKDIEDKTTQLLVRDPGEIVILGGDEQTTLGCGLQEPARRLSVEYFEERDSKWKTSGEVTLIEFH